MSEGIAALLAASGASDANAAVVSDHLVESERLGLSSHGLIRVRQYLNEISTGLLFPAATPTMESENPTVGHLDGHFGFGQVAGLAAATLAEEKASAYGTGFVTARRLQHTGRLGAYTEPLAARGYMVLAFASGAPRFHRVVPFGGRDGRLSTNPIAWAAPTLDGVISADFSTSAVPEGRIRVFNGAGRPAPPDTICDSEGMPTTDTSRFYGVPEEGIAPGALLPLGGPLFGHKGYSLALMSELMSTTLAGDLTSVADGRANNLAILAIASDERLPERSSDMAAYMKSSRPRVDNAEVLMPGEPERRRYASSDVIEVPDFIWSSLLADFASAGLAPPDPY